MSTKTTDPATASMEANLEAKTGRSMGDWIAEVRKRGLDKHGRIVQMLKADFRITHGYANLIAHRSLESSADQQSEVDLINAQYRGTKRALRDIYDVIVEAVSEFGTDIEIAPKKAYVSLRRKKQFALVQPSTTSRVDLGVNLKGREPAGRLEASGSFSSMVSHRVRLGAPSDVDGEVVDWLRQAYDMAG